MTGNLVDSPGLDSNWDEAQIDVGKSHDWHADLEMTMEIHGMTIDDLEAYVKMERWRQTEEAMHFFQTLPEDYGTCYCFDCGVSTIEIGEYYAVMDHIWEESRIEDERPENISGMFLCIGCLEGRLGRELVREDFVYVLINWHPLYHRSDRFADRLRRHP